MARTILVTGALGQIGTELVPALRDRYGADRVVASDLRVPASTRDALRIGGDGPFEQADCTDPQQIQEIIRRHDIDAIYHLAALLSVAAEDRPQAAWQLNMGGLYTILEAARRNECALFVPSSIGAFGPSTPPENTPQVTIQRPTTLYGVAKVAGELLCDFYAARFGTDTRGIRLPGLISHVAPPGGGATDYAVDIFYQAIRYHHYTCFLGPEIRLDMMYMPDAIRAMIELMEADSARLQHRNAFNLAAINVTPQELAAAIRSHIPDFRIDYEIDPVLERIAESWPRRVDDTAARDEWGWKPRFDLDAMTADMLEKLGKRLKTAR